MSGSQAIHINSLYYREKHCSNLSKAAQIEKEAGGSTWPKLRENPGVAVQDAMAASQRRKITVRPSVFPVFPSPHQQQNESYVFVKL